MENNDKAEAAVTHTTEDVIRLIAGACRAMNSPLTEPSSVHGIRASFAQCMLDLAKVDPATPTILRRLAHDRLRRAAGGDPRAQALADDPSDPFHYHLLLTMSDQVMLADLARGMNRPPDPLAVMTRAFRLPGE